MNLRCCPFYDPPEPPGASWCDECGTYGCQCDRDYLEHLDVWMVAVASGEFDTGDVCGVAHVQMQEAA
ncbi:MAG TPA: hypothetical protein VGW38_01700 [Chloroflexota bacterium]|nr:hypothetical protein [Chloroflexota bacterium]